MRATRLMVVLTVLALAGACSGEPERESTPPRTWTATVVSVGDDAPWLTADRDYRVVGTAVGVLHGRAAWYVGSSSDGTQIHVREAESADGDPARYDPYEVALVSRDPQDGEVKVLSDRAARQGKVDTDRLPGRALQIGPVTVSGDHVVWVEGSRVEYGDLYVYDLRNGRETLLASSAEFGRSGAPWPSAMTTPVIAGDRVHFVGYDDGDPDGDLGPTSAFTVPIDGREAPTKLAEGAKEVFGDLGGRLQVVIDGHLVQWDPSKGAAGEVPGTRLPTSIGAFANDGVRVTVHEDSGDVQVDTPSRSGFVVSAPHGARLDRINVTERWVSFTVELNDRPQGYLLDLTTGRLMRLRDVEFTSVTRLTGNRYDLAPTSGPRAQDIEIIELLPPA